jgi:hypothetical protein
MRPSQDGQQVVAFAASPPKKKSEINVSVLIWNLNLVDLTPNSKGFLLNGKPRNLEKQNHTLRMHCRRLNRLTDAFSKKFENFQAAVALNFAYYFLSKRMAPFA